MVARRSQAGQQVTYQAAKSESGELRRFLAAEWRRADQRLFGATPDWTSQPLVIEAHAGRELIGTAIGEVIAGIARLNDVLVTHERQRGGIGGHLVERFCARAGELGAARCYLRCPATDSHRRFYERHGFVLVARLPRYYHDHDFLEYLRDPIQTPPGRG
ncbi:MAG TPA: GNAT family N-acetyltransferase [Actinomycetota bacterium]